MTKTVLNVALYNINNSITIIMEFLLHILCTAAHLENTDNMLSWLTVILLDLFYTDSIYINVNLQRQPVFVQDSAHSADCHMRKT